MFRKSDQIQQNEDQQYHLTAKKRKRRQIFQQDDPIKKTIQKISIDSRWQSEDKQELEVHRAVTDSQI